MVVEPLSFHWIVNESSMLKLFLAYLSINSNASILSLPSVEWKKNCCLCTALMVKRLNQHNQAFH